VHSTLARAAETALLLRDAGFPGAALVPDAALREGAPAVPSPKCVTSRSTRRANRDLRDSTPALPHY
jgi:hypothetical protein